MIRINLYRECGVVVVVLCGGEEVCVGDVLVVFEFDADDSFVCGGVLGLVGGEGGELCVVIAGGEEEVVGGVFWAEDAGAEVVVWGEWEEWCSVFVLEEGGEVSAFDESLCGDEEECGGVWLGDVEEGGDWFFVGEWWVGEGVFGVFGDVGGGGGEEVCVGGEESEGVCGGEGEVEGVVVCGEGWFYFLVGFGG